MGSPLRAFVRIAAYLTLTAALFPIQAFALKFNKQLSVRLPVFYHRTCTRILGFRVRVHGRMHATPPVLFACNHTSYSDIAILGSCCRPLSSPRPRLPVGRCSAFWQSCSGRSSLIAARPRRLGSATK